ncbi:hypothetical protein [Bacillus piscicola]|uniref:hypothetical protein n=1 Tax=Bacillus piscicola TaxID=1632684 RepID=UPI003B839CE7
MRLGPVTATKRALEKAAWSTSDLDLIDANEAYAAQSILLTTSMPQKRPCRDYLSTELILLYVQTSALKLVFNTPVLVV